MNEIKWDGKPISQDGIYTGLPIERYHGNICVGPSVSSSGLRTMENDSPAHYWLTSPFNPKYKKDDEKKVIQSGSDAFSLGHAAHTLLLGESHFKKKYIIRPSEWKSWQTGVSQRWRVKQRRAGLTVLVPNDIDLIAGMAESLAKHPYAVDLLRGGIERSIIHRDPLTGVWLKSRPDSIPSDSTINADLKTTVCSHPDKVDRDIIKYLYHMQAALGGMCMREILEEEPSEFVFIFVEKKPPHCVTVTQLSDKLLQYGYRLCRTQINRFADCIKSGEWPGYTDRPRTTFIPDWYDKQLDARSERGELAK